MLPMMDKKVAVVLVVVLVLWSVPHTWAANPSKVYMTNTYGKWDVVCDPYVIAKGDQIWDVLSRNRDISEHDFRRFFEILKLLGLRAKDVNKFYSAQRLSLQEQVKARQGTTGAGPNDMAEQTAADNLYVTHQVRRGECMSKIVTAYLGVRWSQLPKGYMRTFVRFNPDMKNVHELEPGQRIRIPELTPGLAYPSASDQNVPWWRVIVQETAKRLDTEFFSSRQCDFPGTPHDDVRLELAALPVLDLEDGGHLILSSQKGLPENLKKMMRAFWKPVIAIHIDDPAEPETSGLDKIFCAVFGAEFQQSIDLPVRHGGAQITLRGDWVFIEKDDTGTPTRYRCITLISHSAERTSKAVKDYLAERNVLVADVLASGSYHNMTSTSRITDLSEHMMSTIDGSGQEVFLSGFVRAIGYFYDPGAPVNSADSGSQGKARAGFIRVGRDSDIAVDFGLLTDDARATFESTGAKVLSIEPDDELSTIAKNILRLTETPYEEDPVLFAADRPRSRATSLTIPGFLVSCAGGQKALLTRVSLHPKMREFLSEQQIKPFEIVTVQ